MESEENRVVNSRCDATTLAKPNKLFEGEAGNYYETFINKFCFFYLYILRHAMKVLGGALRE